MKAVLLVLLAGCDPIWGAHVKLRDPANRPVEGATVAVACREANINYAAAKTDADGVAQAGGLGTQFPPGCDVYVAKPGYRTQRIPYRDICPGNPSDCERVFHWDLILEPN